MDSDLTLNEIRVESASSVAEAKDGFPVANLDDATVICSWCHFLCHLGQGPVKHVLCNLCKLDMAEFPEVCE